MLNKIFLQGRLVNDPELKQTPSGVSVATFRIAVDRDRKNKDGEKETDFVTIIAWRNTADFVSKYFSKGRMILIVGRLQIRNYTDKDGNKRTAAEVVADDVYFSDTKKDDSSSNGGGYSAPNYSAYNPPAIPDGGFTEMNEDDGELPF